jgi:hypothetical protein
MPLYEYENKRTGERFTEHLPIDKRDFPCRNNNIRRVVTAPNLSIISDVGGKEDKGREQMMQAAERGYREREEKNIKVPDWSKERRERNKQKRKWL